MVVYLSALWLGGIQGHDRHLWTRLIFPLPFFLTKAVRISIKEIMPYLGLGPVLILLHH
jgi:hypothetical protein